MAAGDVWKKLRGTMRDIFGVGNEEDGFNYYIKHTNNQYFWSDILPNHYNNTKIVLNTSGYFSIIAELSGL